MDHRTFQRLPQTHFVALVATLIALPTLASCANPSTNSTPHELAVKDFLQRILETTGAEWTLRAVNEENGKLTATISTPRDLYRWIEARPVLLELPDDLRPYAIFTPELLAVKKVEYECIFAAGAKTDIVFDASDFDHPAEPSGSPLEISPFYTGADHIFESYPSPLLAYRQAVPSERANDTLYFVPKTTTPALEPALFTKDPKRWEAQIQTAYRQVSDAKGDLDRLPPQERSNRWETAIIPSLAQVGVVEGITIKKPLDSVEPSLRPTIETAIQNAFKDREFDEKYRPLLGPD